MAPSRRSPTAETKASTKRTVDDFPAHSLETLLKDLATITQDRLRFGQATFDQVTSPTPLQQRVFELLRVSWRA